MPKARACSRGSGNMVTIMPSATAELIAPPIPCTNLAATSIAGLTDSPHSSEAAVNTARPQIRMRLRPMRSPSRPASSSSPPNAIRYAFTTHARSDCVKPRSLWIDGRATLTMVPSRMIIRIPAHRTNNASHRRSSLDVEILIRRVTRNLNRLARELNPDGLTRPEQVPLEKLDQALVDKLPAVAAGETVALILQRDVFDWPTEGAQPPDELIGFLGWDTRIVVALNHQQRAAHVLDIRDWRALHQALPVSVEVADPELVPAAPVGRVVLEHGHEVGRTKQVDPAAPELRQSRHASQGCETPVRATHDAQPVRVEVWVRPHPFGHRAQVGQIDPAPITVNATLPDLAVPGGPVDVGRDHRDAPRDHLQNGALAQGWPRLCFGPAVDEQEGRHARGAPLRPVEVARNVAFDVFDAEGHRSRRVSRQRLTPEEPPVFASNQLQNSYLFRPGQREKGIRGASAVGGDDHITDLSARFSPADLAGRVSPLQ